MCLGLGHESRSEKASKRNVGYDDRMKKAPNPNHLAESPVQEHKSPFPIRSYLYKR